MKLPFLLCALVLSVNGWCANAIPSQHSAQAVTPLLTDRMETAMIGWALFAYFAAITWWAITAKHSLDKILKDVLQSIAQYP